MRLSVTLAVLAVLLGLSYSASFVASYYDSGAATVPRYRVWDNTWGAEQSLPDAGASNNYWKVLKTSPEYKEALLGFYNGNGVLVLYFFNGTGWEGPMLLGGPGVATTYRPFDIAYFNDTGNAMIVYYDGTSTLKYRVWDSGTSTLGSQQSLNPLPSSSIYWVRLEVYNSTRAVAVSLDANYNLYAQTWDGTGWSSPVLLGSTGYYWYQDFDVAFEHDTGHAVVVWGEANNIPKYRVWDGSTWSAQASLNSVGAWPRWIKLRAAPAGEGMMFCSLDAASDINCQPWDGSKWGANTELNTNIEASWRPDFGLAYYTIEKAVVVYGRRNIDPAYYRTWDGSTWSAEAPMLTGTTDPREIELYPDPNSNRVMALITDDGYDLNAELWDGSAWIQITELETSSSRARKSFAGAFFYTDTIRPSLAPKTVSVNAPLFYNCPSTVYYEVNMTNGTSTYDLYLVDSSGTQKQHFVSNQTRFLGSYNITTDDPTGNWTVRVADQVWNLQAEKAFEVRAAPAESGTLSTGKTIYATAESGSTVLVLAPANGTASCNITAYRSSGGTPATTTATVSGVTALQVSSFAGWSYYPRKIVVECNNSVALSLAPIWQSFTMGYVSSGKKWYASGYASDYYLLSADQGGAYTITSYYSNGGQRSTYSGALADNGSVSRYVAVTNGLVEIEYSGSGHAYAKPDGENAVIYSEESLFTHAYAPLYEKWGSNILLSSPLGNANVTLIVRPANYGECQDLGSGYSVCQNIECRYNTVIPAKGSFTTDIDTLTTACGVTASFPDNPFASVEVISDSPLAGSVIAWYADGTSPLVLPSGTSKRLMFPLQYSGFYYMILGLQDNTTVTVGSSTYNVSRYQVVAGYDPGNLFNLTADKPVGAMIRQSYVETVPMVVSG